MSRNQNLRAAANWFAGLIALLSSATLIAVATAAPGPTDQKAPPRAELVVFEVENCAYCSLLRRDVLPDYLKSTRAKTVPLRFVNMRRADISKMKLNGPVRIVPTVVLMMNGREVDRIAGYAGREPFFYMISRIMR